MPDGTILRVLRNLLYLKEERLSYRSLEVEQIGSVYEAVMGYRVETATGRSVAIRPEKRHGAPVTIDLDELLAAPANKRTERFKKLTDRKLPASAATALRNARTEDDLVAALDRLIDRRLTPAPVPAGSLVFQPSPERRRTGSHYTPQTLTGPIVTKALEPILRRLGPNPTPEAILALKICDPAMGSGAFLVEAMRQLAKLLVEAWNHHGNPPRIPADETPILFASRSDRPALPLRRGQEPDGRGPGQALALAGHAGEGPRLLVPGPQLPPRRFAGRPLAGPDRGLPLVARRPAGVCLPQPPPSGCRWR